MLITTEEIGERLYALCPEMNDWLPTITEALTVEQGEVERLIALHRGWCCAPGWLDRMWDCDKLAAAAVTAIHRSRALAVEQLPEAERTLLALGVINGSRWEGVAKEHTVNFFCGREGIFFFDIQTARIWPGRLNEDQYFFARM